MGVDIVHGCIVNEYMTKRNVRHDMKKAKTSKYMLVEKLTSKCKIRIMEIMMFLHLGCVAYIGDKLE